MNQSSSSSNADRGGMPTPSDLLFDRELQFDDIIRAEQAEILRAAMSAILGCDLQWLRDPSLAPKGYNVAAVVHELEPLIWLSAPAPVTRLTALAVMVQRIVIANTRYLLASYMHLDVVQANYDELLEKHEKLQASEAMYKELSATLEQKVQEQVQVIELSQRRLYESEKLSAVGQLAAGVAHEINTPVGFVSSNLRSAQDYVSNIQGYRERLQAWPEALAEWQRMQIDEDMEDFNCLLEECVTGMRKVARIVSDLKDFSHLDKTGDTMMHIDDMLRSVLNVSASQLEKVRIEFEPCGLPALLKGNAAKLTQAFHSIVLNSIQAMPAENAHLSIVARSEPKAVRICIRDNGSGIAPEHLPRVFEPFFTTKPVGSGTGLGLTVAHDAVRQLKGEIEIKSVPGEGTQVSILLPIPA